MGIVAAIFTAPAGESPMEPRDEVRAVPGRGLDGDRYFSGKGTYSDRPGHREVTLIEIEAIEGMNREEDLGFDPSLSRRNIVTRGVALNHLVDREFSVGEVRLRGIKLAEPCAHMEGLSGVTGARKALIHRGGLRAEIVTEGVVRVGDAVQTD
jgi:MOSC domain-containing protein YiiM